MAMMAFPFGPLYRYWADCGLGSTVTTEDVQEVAPGIRMFSRTSMTLCALDCDKATVDMVVRQRVEGAPVDIPPTETLQEVEIPAAPPRSEEEEGGMEEGSGATLSPESEVEETIEVLGRPLPCRRIERLADVGGRKLRMTVWLSDQVPGGMARSELGFDGVSSQRTITTVVSFLKKGFVGG